LYGNISKGNAVTWIPALTVYQPWASLIAIRAKPYEFRGRPAPGWVRGRRIAIHASARPVKPKEVDTLIASLRSDDGFGTGLIVAPALDFLLRLQADHFSIPLAHVVCTALMGASVPAEEIAREYPSFVGDSDRIDHQIYGWPLTQIEELKPPVPARGQQGFWRWTVDGVAA
jgi:hypothetical protein